jgi:hypothetical protein
MRVPHGHRLGLIVRHVDEGRFQALMQFRDLGACLHSQFGIQVRERLVHEEDRRMAHDCATERDTLTLTARQGFWLPIQEVPDMEHLRGFFDAPINLGFRRFAQFQAKRHIIVHAHMRIERITLEHHRNVAILGRHIIDHPITDHNVAVRHLFQPRKATQRRRLAASRRSHQHQKLLVGNIEGEIFEGGEITEALPDVVELNGCHACVLLCQTLQRLRLPVIIYDTGAGPLDLRTIRRALNVTVRKLVLRFKMTSSSSIASC